jgi:hypothetical protein
MIQELQELQELQNGEPVSSRAHFLFVAASLFLL